MEQLIRECENDHSVVSIRTTLQSHLLSLIYQQENNSEEFVSVINKQLQTSTNRSKAIELLNDMVLQLPQEIVIDNALLWVNVCLNIHPNNTKTTKKYLLLEKLISICNQAPDFNKVFINLLSKVVDLCLGISTNNCLVNSSLKCIRTAMVYYPGPCAAYRNRIDVYLTKFLDMKEPTNIMRKAGGAFHMLQQVGGAGSDGINHTTNWTKQVNKLCSTVHSLMNVLFDDTVELNDYEDVGYKAFDFTPNDDINVLHYRMQNILNFLKCFMLEAFPVPKTVSLQAILDIIKRGLTIDCNMTNLETDVNFLPILINLQIQLLELLHSFISCFKQNLLVLSFTITKLLTDCLVRSQENKHFKYNKKYQIVVHKVLCLWITTIQNKMNNVVHEKIIACILNNITPSKNEVTLSLNVSSSKKSKGKSKQKTVREKTSAGNSYLAKDNEDLCASSLTTLNTLLQNTILNLKSPSLTIMYETVMKQLLEIQGGRIPSVYTSTRCKVLLYEVLVSLFMQPNPLIPPPIQEATQILMEAQHVWGKSTEISTVCTSGLALMEKLCQPVCPSLYVRRAANDGIDLNNKKRVIEDDPVTSLLTLNESEEEHSEPASKKIKILDVVVIRNSEEPDVEVSKPVIETQIVDDEVNNEIMETAPSNEAEIEVRSVDSDVEVIEDGHTKEVDREIEKRTDDQTVETRQITGNEVDMQMLLKKKAVIILEDCVVKEKLIEKSLLKIVNNDPMEMIDEKKDKDCNNADDMLNSFVDIVNY